MNYFLKEYFMSAKDKKNIPTQKEADLQLMIHPKLYVILILCYFCIYFVNVLYTIYKIILRKQIYYKSTQQFITKKDLSNITMHCDMGSIPSINVSFNTTTIFFSWNAKLL